VQWSAHQAGVEVPDGSWLQYRQLEQQGGAVSVEQALHTRGALLFYFSSPPTGGRPAEAHVAISLGDGRTIEARNSRDGVGVFTASTVRFNYAAVIPQLSAVPSGGFGTSLAMVPGGMAPGFGAVDPFGMPGAALPSAVVGGPGQTDSDGDGLTDRFEGLLGTDPNRADTDGDGLGDSAETATYHTDPLRADTDGDGVTDAAEAAAGADPGRAALPQGAADAGFGGMQTLDTDQDGLSDYAERTMGTRADVADSDSDGLTDGVERGWAATRTTSTPTATASPTASSSRPAPSARRPTTRQVGCTRQPCRSAPRCCTEPGAGAVPGEPHPGGSPG
jgi:hypothetical protein